MDSQTTGILAIITILSLLFVAGSIVVIVEIITDLFR